MFGLHHHHQDPSAGLHHHHHHHHQPRGPVTGLKEEPLTSSQLAAARAWMQPGVVEQTRSVPHTQLEQIIIFKNKKLTGIVCFFSNLYLKIMFNIYVNKLIIFEFWRNISF